MAQVEFNNTRFIFRTNFQGDPERDTYGSRERRGNVVIPDPELAMRLRADGFNVRETRPMEGMEDGFEPEYYVAVKLNFDSRPGFAPPTVCIVPPGGPPVRLDEESVAEIDDMQDARAVRNVNVLCNMRFNRDGRNTLYAQYLYVEQAISDDPYAHLYGG